MKRLVFAIVCLFVAMHGRANLPPPQATLDLEWEAIEDAIGYEVKLVPKEGGKPIVIKVNEPKLSQRVPVGVYSVLMRSQDKETRYYGPWGEPSEVEVTLKLVQLVQPADQAVLSEPKEKSLEVAFEWKPIPDAKQYTLKVWSDDKRAEPIVVTTEETTTKVVLPTGRVYHWQVTFVTTRAVRYQAKPLTYSFDLLGRKLVPPTIDERIVTQPALPVSWSPTEGADRYDARVLRRALDETVWQPMVRIEGTTATSWKTAKLPPGAYRIEVVAHGRNRMSSDPGAFEFVVKPTVEELEAALASVGSKR